MAYFAVVIHDPDLAHKGEIRRGQRHSVPRAAGSLHAHLDEACPEARPNCRNCGDPAFAASCSAAGHCPACGTLHGLAPISVLAANGYAALIIPPPAEGEVWNAAARKFVKG